MKAKSAFSCAPDEGFAASSSVKSFDHSEDFEIVSLWRASDPLAGAGRVDILKIDTEGHKVRMLRDLAGCRADISIILLEMHDNADRHFLRVNCPIVRFSLRQPGALRAKEFVTGQARATLVSPGHTSHCQAAGSGACVARPRALAPVLYASVKRDRPFVPPLTRLRAVARRPSSKARLSGNSASVRNAASR